MQLPSSSPDLPPLIDLPTTHIFLACCGATQHGWPKENPNHQAPIQPHVYASMMSPTCPIRLPLTGLELKLYTSQPSQPSEAASGDQGCINCTDQPWWCTESNAFSVSNWEGIAVFTLALVDRVGPLALQPTELRPSEGEKPNCLVPEISLDRAGRKLFGTEYRDIYSDLSKGILRRRIFFSLDFTFNL